MKSRTSVCVNHQALHHNYLRVKEITNHRKVMAMIKANAYGHGLVATAKTLAQADAFGVACLSEAMALREAKFSNPITVMQGFNSADDLHAMVQNNIAAVVHDLRQVTLLEQQRVANPIDCWLKLDTGMHRLGILQHEFMQAYQRLSACKGVNNIYLMTHFSDADVVENMKTARQHEIFQHITHDLQGQKSTANSAAILAWPDTHCDWVRPGIMLYGVSPFAGQTGVSHQLLPVMTVTARLMAIRQLHQGDTIGYGSTWQCPENLRVGVVSIGYGDGYPRHVISGTPTLLNNRRAPIVGRVSMDLLSIDLRNHPQAEVGDTVTLWGDGLPVEEIARAANTIPYELLCNIKLR